MPTAGLRDHVTFVFDVPVTVAVNCSVCDELKDTLAGATVIPTAAGGLGLKAAAAIGLLISSIIEIA